MTLTTNSSPAADAGHAFDAAGAAESCVRTAAAQARARLPDDRVMIRTAAELTRDLSAPRADIYWADMAVSAVVGYGAMAVAVLADGFALMLVASFVAVLALYRAGSFIHEITHMKRGSVPGFWLGWNIMVGVPLLIPSFMYEGVHNLHHARTRYGTAEDPEYLPLALMKPWTVPLFVIASAFAPVGLIIRYGVLSPLSLVVAPLRRLIVERYSGLVINPAFRRRPAEGAARREWIMLETAASLWAMTLIAGVASGVIALPCFVTALAIVSATLVANQVRTLVAHLWENEGEVMTTTAQYLDSVNVPPPALLPGLWAPVGLRYHALHHLLPGLPYHALGEAHRRISAALGQETRYHEASYAGLPGLIGRLVGSTISRKR